METTKAWIPLGPVDNRTRKTVPARLETSIQTFSFYYDFSNYKIWISLQFSQVKSARRESTQSRRTCSIHSTRSINQSSKNDFWVTLRFQSEMLSKRPWMVIHQFALTWNFASSFPRTCLAFRLRWWTFIWLLRVLFHKIQVWWLGNSRFHHFRNWLQMHFLKFPVSKSAKSILQCHIEPKCRPQHNWFWLILEHRSKMIISTNCHPKNSKINYRNDQFLSECTHCQWNSIYAPWVMILWNFDVMRTFAVSNVCKYSNHRRIWLVSVILGSIRCSDVWQNNL